MKVVAIIQARTGSTRFEAKILKKLEGRAMLDHVVERVGRTKKLDEIIVAIPDLKQDDGLASHIQTLESAKLYRGSESDVLCRYFEAAKSARADIVVRITSDCPVICPSLIDQSIELLLGDRDSVSFVTNTIDRTYPRGLDVETFHFRDLESAHREAKAARDREHVTLYFKEHTKRFPSLSFKHHRDLSSWRLTVDTFDDFRLIEKIYAALWHKNPYFELPELEALLDAHPEWKSINAHIEQKKV